MVLNMGELECSSDAAVVLALAATAVAFAEGPEQEAERWLRALRGGGLAGRALLAAGVGDEPSVTATHGPATLIDERTGHERVDGVMAEARLVARERGAATLSSADLLRACLEVYGEAMATLLSTRGSSPRQVLEHLDALAPSL